MNKTLVKSSHVPETKLQPETAFAGIFAGAVGLGSN
jgi:hypothetical protein